MCFSLLSHTEIKSFRVTLCHCRWWCFRAFGSMSLPNGTYLELKGQRYKSFLDRIRLTLFPLNFFLLLLSIYYHGRELASLPWFSCRPMREHFFFSSPCSVRLVSCSHTPTVVLLRRTAWWHSEPYNHHRPIVLRPSTFRPGFDAPRRSAASRLSR